MSYTEYSCSRLTFKACIIESLKENDVFCIKTPVGSFQMTKGDFYKSFPNVIQTKSYRESCGKGTGFLKKETQIREKENELCF